MSVPLVPLVSPATRTPAPLALGEFLSRDAVRLQMDLYHELRHAVAASFGIDAFAAVSVTCCATNEPDLDLDGKSSYAVAVCMVPLSTPGPHAVRGASRWRLAGVRLPTDGHLPTNVELYVSGSEDATAEVVKFSAATATFDGWGVRGRLAELPVHRGDLVVHVRSPVWQPVDVLLARIVRPGPAAAVPTAVPAQAVVPAAEAPDAAPSTLSRPETCKGCAEHEADWSRVLEAVTKARVMVQSAKATSDATQRALDREWARVPKELPGDARMEDGASKAVEQRACAVLRRLGLAPSRFDRTFLERGNGVKNGLVITSERETALRHDRVVLLATTIAASHDWTDPSSWEWVDGPRMVKPHVGMADTPGALYYAERD